MLVFKIFGMSKLTEDEKALRRKIRKIMKKVDRYADDLCCACGHDNLVDEACVIRDEVEVDIEFLMKSEFRDGYKRAANRYSPERVVVT